ncbi:SDR family NAD(P)-dependent oxidoreductase [Microvirga antarctica]|uniref:SDR family NAD(P)-dependent oxidoreductase n=1 Tax=Microvirga antarctica TaxID=2819233 RepID=UPI001B31658E|nr:SDR family oxidoreductase [Microvirga antarctica]
MRIVVTGGCGGIGQSVVELLDERGHEVIRLDRRPNGRPGGAIIETDLTDLRSTQAAFDEIATGGAIQGLVMAAGLGAGQAGDSTVEMLDPEVWSNLIAANLSSVYFSLRCALPLLREGAPSSAVTIASVAGLVGSPGGVATHGYAASKGGAIALTRAAAVTYAPERIRFNCICPSAVQTPLIDAFISAHPERESALRSRHPIGRIGLPREIAETVAFLLDPGAGFLTGATVPVDGGLTAQ